MQVKVKDRIQFLVKTLEVNYHHSLFYCPMGWGLNHLNYLTKAFSSKRIFWVGEEGRGGGRGEREEGLG